MDLEHLKKCVVMYAGYKTTNNQELKIIENNIFNSTAMYFRPIEKDMHGKPTFNENFIETQKDDVLQELKEMKQVSENFLINELVVSFMSKAHNDWIIAHREELEKNNMKNPEKFVPIELLTAKEIKEYMSIITPIFKSLDISFDEKEVRKAYTRKQLFFMIKNELFSKENLEKKIQNINVFNPELIEISSTDETSMQELFKREEVSRNIARNVKDRININISDKFKEVLKQNSDVGFFTVDKVQKKRLIYKFSDNISQKKIGFKKHALPRLEKPITKAAYYMARFGGVVFAPNVKKSDYKYYDYSNNAYRFKEYKDCSFEQKRAIDRRQRKLQKVSKSLNYSLDSDNAGVVTMVIVKKELKFPALDYINSKEKSYQRETEVIQIPISQRELIEMNILPEEVGWEKEKKAKINSSSKSFFASDVKQLQASNDFRDSLSLLNKSLGDNNTNNQNKIIDKKTNKEKEL